MKSFLFNIVKVFFYTWSILPLNVLYIFSTVLYYPLYYVVGYRRKVVRTNLVNSFPDKSLTEIKTIEKKFYRHFCNYLMETIKLHHISDEEMKRRYKIKNPEILNRLVDEEKFVITLLGHYGNWEWLISFPSWADKPINMAQIYRPLKNKAADKFFLKLRNRYNTQGIPKNDTLREILKLKQKNIPTFFGFISDQTPSRNNIHYWTTFLNQDTPCITGSEKIARKINSAVIYMDINVVSKGYYELEIKVISESADRKSVV